MPYRPWTAEAAAATAAAAASGDHPSLCSTGDYITRWLHLLSEGPSHM